MENRKNLLGKLISTIEEIESYIQKRKELKEIREIERRNKKIKELSEIVGEMPVEFKQLLTTKSNPIITPQDSFCKYFHNAVPKYDQRAFNVKFVELFESLGKRLFFGVFKTKKSKGAPDTDKFWQHFEILFEGMPNSKVRLNPLEIKLKLFLLQLLKVFKIVKK